MPRVRNIPGSVGSHPAALKPKALTGQSPPVRCRSMRAELNRALLPRKMRSSRSAPPSDSDRGVFGAEAAPVELPQAGARGNSLWGSMVDYSTTT
jgi:hypothetical protein